MIDFRENPRQYTVFLVFVWDYISGLYSTFERVVERCRLGSAKSTVPYLGDTGESSPRSNVFVENV